MRRLPPEWHLLRGNPSKRAHLPGPAFEIPETLPPAPPYLSPEAAEEWRTTGEQLLRIGALSTLELSLFAVYCETAAQWRQAIAAADAAEPNSKEAMVLRRVERTNCQVMMRLAKCFGMSPAARARIAG